MRGLSMHELCNRLLISQPRIRYDCCDMLVDRSHSCSLYYQRIYVSLYIRIRYGQYPHQQGLMDEERSSENFSPLGLGSVVLSLKTSCSKSTVISNFNIRIRRDTRRVISLLSSCLSNIKRRSSQAQKLINMFPIINGCSSDEQLFTKPESLSFDW